MNRMQKNFDDWNKQKKKIENSDKEHLFKEGDIWWISIGLNIGQESSGKGKNFRRPVLVVRKLSRQNFIGIPLSTKVKTGSWFVDVEILEENQVALLYQIRMFSSDRFQRRLTTLEDKDFERVKEKLEALLKLSK